MYKANQWFSADNWSVVSTEPWHSLYLFTLGLEDHSNYVVIFHLCCMSSFDCCLMFIYL